jgi:serine phosphatase RsbU (regulator of sigma subunit)
VERELTLARNVQRSFLPRSMPKVRGMRFFAFYEAQGQVGGDYYDVVPLPDGRIAALLGDVSGKGVPAALLMAKASSDAKVALLSKHDQPAAAMNWINNSICAAGLEDKFLTLAMCIVDPASGKLGMVNAGHMSPLVRRLDGTLDEPAHPDVSGPPVGVAEDFEFEYCETALQPGELAVLYTDGISEAMSAAGEEFGMERLRKAVAGAAANPQAVGDAVLAAVRAHVNGHKQHDDMAVLIFGWDAA